MIQKFLETLFKTKNKRWTQSHLSSLSTRVKETTFQPLHLEDKQKKPQTNCLSHCTYKAFLLECLSTYRLCV